MLRGCVTAVFFKSSSAEEGAKIIGSLYMLLMSNTLSFSKAIPLRMPADYNARKAAQAIAYLASKSAGSHLHVVKAVKHWIELGRDLVT